MNEHMNPSMNELAYTYDGSLEGLLGAVFHAYAHKEDPLDITQETKLQPRLGQRIEHIPTNIEHAIRVQKGICKTRGSAVFDAIKSASLSDDPQAGSIIYRFIRHAMTMNTPYDCKGCSRKKYCGGLCTKPQKNSVLNDFTHPAVEPLQRLNRSVSNERHYIMQFLRFEHMETGVWFAKCNPQASVVPLVMDWFTARFNTQPFMIYDENHNLAGIYEGSDWHLVKTETLLLPDSAPDEKIMQSAWKRFYDTIAVESRHNPELRRQFMPKRLWKNITEMQETIETSLRTQ